VADNRSHTVKTVQRRVVIGTLTLALIAAVIGIPLIVNGDLRLSVAHRLHLAPGWNAEQVAEGDDGVTLVVLPLKPITDTGRDTYRYKAQYLATPSGDGMVLTDIDSGRTLVVPLKDFDLISADPEGEHVLFRDEGSDGTEAAVLVDVAALTASTLPEGQAVPDLPGDWETPVWEKSAGRCDRFSVTGRYLACFNRAEAASYLAGDWQIDVQVYGDFQKSAEIYRGAGFLPIVGWANDDRALYFQNENGIWRADISDDIFDSD
jgi:hypothetical protein